MTVVTVLRDPAVRLAGLLLAAGSWPEAEQARKPYKPHRVAEGARRALAGLREHPAVATVQVATELDPGLGMLFGAAATGTWAVAGESVSDFITQATVSAYLAQVAGEWQSAEDELAAVLARADLGAFLNELSGGAPVELRVFPNLLYPGRERVVADIPRGLLLSQPPPPAWGSSPPWRYTERPDEVLAATAESLATALFARATAHPVLAAQAGAAGLAAAVLFLRAAEGPEAADQFMLMEQRTRKLPQLPRVVAALEGARGYAALEAALRTVSS